MSLRSDKLETANKVNYCKEPLSTDRGASKMGYEEVWRTLDLLVVEFKKRGETIPVNVIEDLRAAKTMIQVLKADQTRMENAPSIEMYLGNVESYLIFETHHKFGAEMAEEWMQKLREARQKTPTDEEQKKVKPVSKFVAGMPKGQKWLRVQITDETPKNIVEQLAAECGLSTKMQSDGYALVHGDENGIKLFIQKTGERLQRRKVR